MTAWTVTLAPHACSLITVTPAGPAAYQAEVGVLVVHVKDPMDDDAPLPKEERTGPPPPQPPEASMSYVAYFQGDHENPCNYCEHGVPFFRLRSINTLWSNIGHVSCRHGKNSSC